MTHVLPLTYGANPNQSAARLFAAAGTTLPLRLLNGSCSYINLLDALNAWQLVRELRQVIGLPAGAAVAVAGDHKSVYAVGVLSAALLS